MHPQLFKLTALAAMLCASGYSFADATMPAGGTATLSTVTVTGQSRSTRTENSDSYTTSAMRTTTGLALSPKETPQSVSVITKMQLDDQGISRMEDALRTTTGVNVIRDSGRYRYQSRGFYIDQIEEDGMATTVAGGNSGNPYRDAQSMTDLAVYDHIEVVRGATGLTQANGEPGGTINAVRKKPTAQRRISGDLEADRFGAVRTTADLSGSLNEARTLRGRTVAALERSNSFKNNSDGKNGLLYGVLEADAGENTKFTLGGLYQQQDGARDYFGVPMAEGGRDAGFNRDTYLGLNWNDAKHKKANVSGEAEHYFNNNWKITAKANYIHNESDSRFGALANSGTAYAGLAAGGTLPLNNISRYENTGNQLGFQTNLTGKYAWAGFTHDLFAGYAYSRESGTTRWRRIRNNTAFDPYAWHGGEIAEPDWLQYNDQTFYDSKITSHALMLGTRLQTSAKTHILLGGRFTHWRSVGNIYYDWWNSRADSDADEHAAVQRNRLVPYFGLTYDLTPNQSLYLSYTSIFKPQSNRDKDNRFLDPMMGNNYEIGWKGEWNNRRLNTAVALFDIEQENRPVYVVDNNARGGGYYDALGKVRSRGLDAEVSGNLTDNWKLFAGYTLNNSKYLKTESARYQAGGNFSKHTPKHMLRLYTSYRLPGKAAKWTLGGGLSTQSTTESLYGVKQGGYTLWNANIQYEPSKNLKLSLVGSNLTDKRYFENNRMRTYGINNFYGEPRNLMFKLNWKM